MLSRFEVRKDMVQELTESAATRVGRIATILSGAVRDVTHEVGDWFSDAFEMQEAARRAEAERVAAAGGSTADALDDDAPTDAALDDPALDDPALDDRSEERRVGKECLL